MTPDALYSILGKLTKEWGDYGYRVVELTSDYYGGGVAEIAHSDGSHFFIATDRHGALVTSGDTLPAAVESYAAARDARQRAAIDIGPNEGALIAERAQPGDTCTHAVNSDCPHYS